VTFGAVFSKTPDPLSLPHRRRLCSEHFIENTLMLFSLFLQFVASGFLLFFCAVISSRTFAQIRCSKLFVAVALGRKTRRNWPVVRLIYGD